jgi:hypothetical protein
MAHRFMTHLILCDSALDGIHMGFPVDNLKHLLHIFTNLNSSFNKEGYLSEDYYSRLDKTFVTLFQVVTLDNWSDVAREVMVINRGAFWGSLSLSCSAVFSLLFISLWQSFVNP